jgi:hypothetical protein
MPGRGPQTFKKRQKEQQRKEKQQEKLAKRLQRKDQPLTSQSGSDIASPEEVRELIGLANDVADHTDH